MISVKGKVGMKLVKSGTDIKNGQVFEQKKVGEQNDNKIKKNNTIP